MYICSFPYVFCICNWIKRALLWAIEIANKEMVHSSPVQQTCAAEVLYFTFKIFKKMSIKLYFNWAQLLINLEIPVLQRLLEVKQCWGWIALGWETVQVLMLTLFWCPTCWWGMFAREGSSPVNDRQTLSTPGEQGVSPLLALKVG